MGLNNPRHPGKCWNYPLGKLPVVFYSSRGVRLTQADLPWWNVSPGELRAKGIQLRCEKALKYKNVSEYTVGTNMRCPSLKVQVDLYGSLRGEIREK